MPTVVLLVVLTLWLPVALLLLGNWRGVAATVLFVVLGIVLWAETDVTWRSYLMASLIAHVAIAVPHGRLDQWNRRLGPYWQAAVSVVGLVWLWADAGAPHWPYVVGILLLGGVGAAGGYLVLRLRESAAAAAPVPPDVHQPPPPSSGRPHSGRGAARSGLPARVRPSTPPPAPQPLQPGPDPEPALELPWRPARERESTWYPAPAWEPTPEPSSALEPVLQPPSQPTQEFESALDPPSEPARWLEPEPIISPFDSQPVARPADELRPELPCHGWSPRGRVPSGGPAASQGVGITFDLVPPGTASSDAGRPHMRLTPRLRPAAEVGTGPPDSATVRVSGLARFFPAGTVHGQRSTAPVGESRCELMTVDHFHLHRLSAPLAPLLEPGSPAQAALAALLDNREDPSAAAALQHALPPLPDPAPPEPSAEVTTVVMAADPPPDGASNTRTSATYVAEDTLLPVVDLLARSEGLVRSLADALVEEEPGEQQARFLRTLLLAGRRDGELALLPRPSGPPDETDAATFGLFGCAVVDPDCAVLLHPSPDGPDGWESADWRPATGWTGGR